MVTKEVINQIYKQYNKKPKHVEDLDVGILFEKAGIEHDLMIDPDTNELTISSIPEDSPFHTIPLKNIYGFVPFEEWVCIVLHSSIIFLNCKTPLTTIHLKPDKQTFWKKITNKFAV